MKAVLFIVTALMLSVGIAHAEQRLGYVDLDYITNTVAEGRGDAAQFEAFVRQNQNQLDLKRREIQDKVRRLQQGATTMPEDARQQLQIEIDRNAQDLQRLQQDADVEIATRRTTLIGKIQDEAVQAVRQLQSDGGYDYIFNSEALLAAPPADNVSDQVLVIMGVDPSGE